MLLYKKLLLMTFGTTLVVLTSCLLALVVKNPLPNICKALYCAGHMFCTTTLFCVMTVLVCLDPIQY